jgi:aspartyl-tRNA(Asn)/glutamyl-tRNA(Gln) amidotransferase subunit A
VREVDLPMPDLGNLIGAETYAFHSSRLARTPELYDPRTRSVILEGQAISADESLRLRQALERHRKAIPAAFTTCDLVVLPTLPGLPLLVREATEPFALDACTFAFSLGGWPSLSLPCGFSRSGLPIGLLIGGPPLAEPRILALAQAFEGATDWHSRRPPL